MKKLFCPGCSQEIEIGQDARPGDLIDCPNWAGLTLRLKGTGEEVRVEQAYKVSCPLCEKVIVLPEDARAGDRLSCCGKEFILTYEYGAYALEEYPA